MEVSGKSATAWTLASFLSPLPTGTITYQVAPSYMSEGFHPTKSAHILIGNALSVAQVTA